MDALIDYYIHQGGGGGEHLDDVFGPVYVGCPYMKHENNIPV